MAHCVTHSDFLVTSNADAAGAPDPVNVLPNEELAACKTLTVSDRTAVVLATLSSRGIATVGRSEDFMLAISTLSPAISDSNFVLCFVTTF
jgi:hypothetical protein